MPDYQFTIGKYPAKLSPKIKVLTNRRFTRVLVIGFAGIGKYGHSLWHCLCDCGNGRTIPAGDLLRGYYQSCGCQRGIINKRKSTKHGESCGSILSPEYRVYFAAKCRCQSIYSRDYQHYGAKGIEFRFETFAELLKEVGRRPSPEHSLDRYPNCRGHYEPGNVRWATPPQQARNRITTRWIEAFGRTQCLVDWATEFRISQTLIGGRIKRGWCAECSMTLPPDRTGSATCTHR